MKLRGKVLSFSIPPLIATALIVILVVSLRVSSLMATEISQSLQATAYVFRDAISNLDGNDYKVDENGALWNGEDYNVSEDTATAEKLRKETGITLTIFFGDTRVVSSLTDRDGNSLIGSKAGEATVKTVIGEGHELFAKNINIGGTKYYGYYVPLFNGEENIDGKLEDIVGMVFAGMEDSVVSNTISNVVFNTALIVGLLLVVFVLLDSYLANKMSKRFTASVAVIEKAAGGDFSTNIDEALLKSKDESGDIARAVENLQSRLNDALKNIIKESRNVDDSAAYLDTASKECAQVIEQVETAISEISNGATSQAADTSEANKKVQIMGQLVEATNENVSELIDISGQMKKQGNNAAATLAKLEKVNDETKVAIDKIYAQTNTTNESAVKISEAVSLITAIAEETTLLSLNASIEAARAGEQGRGFAVVASQIQKLAEQSNDSAKTIEEVISALISDSEKSVSIMNDVKEIMSRQSQMVTETDHIFQEVLAGITKSEIGISDISTNMQELNDSRSEVVNLVSNLSAIAEENAASTEETSASASEVSSSIQQVSGNALTLKAIASELNALVNNFTLKA